RGISPSLNQFGFLLPGYAGSSAVTAIWSELPSMKRSIFSGFVPAFFDRLVPPFLRRRLPSLSVRARIALLALIPVVGFVANGFNYIVSEREVGQAFDAVNRSNDLTDASAALRSG